MLSLLSLMLSMSLTAPDRAVLLHDYDIRPLDVQNLLKRSQPPGTVLYTCYLFGT